MLVIAIILGVNVLGKVLIKVGDFDVFSSAALSAALVVALFALNLVLAIVVLSVLSLVAIVVIAKKARE